MTGVQTCALPISGVKGKVEEMTLSELQGLNACFRKQELYPRETIPTLDMVFAAFGTKLLMNVEIKTRNPKRVGKLVDRVIETILYYKNQESIIFSSFNFGDLVKARNVFPEIKTVDVLLPHVEVAGHHGDDGGVFFGVLALEVQHAAEFAVGLVALQALETVEKRLPQTIEDRKSVV